VKTFEVKPEHILLLNRTVINWQDCEFGAPEVDPKRPYGNSDVYSDIAEILGIEPDTGYTWEDAGFSDDLQLRMWTLHKGTKTALEILLHTLLSSNVFSSGVYTADDYNNNWKLNEYV